MFLYKSTSDGIPTGTEFEWYSQENAILIRTVDSRGTHEVVVMGIDAVNLRNFLADHITSTGRATARPKMGEIVSG